LYLIRKFTELGKVKREKGKEKKKRKEGKEKKKKGKKGKKGNFPFWEPQEFPEINLAGIQTSSTSTARSELII
jgi:hypothetical protein